MKKHINCKTVLLGSLLLFSGCQSDKEYDEYNDSNDWQAEVSFEDISSTEGLRTAVKNTGENRYSLSWIVGDVFVAYDWVQDLQNPKVYGYDYIHNSAKFILNKIGNPFVKYDPANKTLAKPTDNHTVYGYYPADKFHWWICDYDNTQEIELPETQEYVSETELQDGVFPMYCKTNTTQFKFRNVCGIVCVSLKAREGEDDLVVKSITLTNTKESLSGLAKISLDKGYPKLTFVDGNSNKNLKLVIPEGKQKSLTPNKTEKFHIVLPPKTYPAGSMRLVIETNKFNCSYIISKEWNIARSSANTHIRNMVLSLGISGAEGVDGDIAE